MTSSVPLPSAPLGRIPVLEVGPLAEGGRWPTKASVGEAIPVRATVFREGHDAFAATAVLIDPDGNDFSATRMVDISPGNDRYEAWLVPNAEGLWHFRIEGWSDPYATWRHDATLKVEAGVDTELMLTEGNLLLGRVLEQLAGELSIQQRHTLAWARQTLSDASLPAAARLAGGAGAEIAAILTEHPLRDYVSPSASYPLIVHRQRALYGSWYEMFPRSEGARRDPVSGEWISGTLRSAARRLPRIAKMGFDVVYLTPIHPIGTTNRKGRNNSLTASAADPGSPYGIGSNRGGHETIHPDLGTFADFDAFVTEAKTLGLEVALDLALQASPDHPWVREHPEWFTTRADGTIAYAENPPKKYQDIYPLNFDNDPEGIYQAIRELLLLWIDHGVTIFRVDNPHTKPLEFWDRILSDIADTNPEVIFLAEAFTRPAMMRSLGMVGFHQSYTYFTWRHSKQELAEYFTEVSGDLAALMRPSFWPTTHDILTPYMQQGGANAFAIRAVLAATGSPTWGIYSGYEFAENVARPGAEEQLNNEKYEYRPRDWDLAEHTLPLTNLLTTLNRIRRSHPALQQLRNLSVHPTTDDATFCFSKRLSSHLSPTGEADTVIVVVNLDPYATRESLIYLDTDALGLTPGASLRVHDELSGEDYDWSNTPFVRLDPNGRCAHILTVQGS